MLAVTFSETFSLGNIVTIGALVLLAGLVAGQFRRGVVSELRSALETASAEIEIQRQRGDRMEADVRALREENAALHAEVKTLRDVLLGGGHLQQPLLDAIQTTADKAVAVILERLDAAGRA